MISSTIYGSSFDARRTTNTTVSFGNLSDPTTYGDVVSAAVDQLAVKRAPAGAQRQDLGARQPPERGQRGRFHRFTQDTQPHAHLHRRWAAS